MMTRRGLKEAPGPRGKYFLGNLSERRSDPLGLYMRGALEYGDVVKFRMGPMRVFLLSNPDHIKYVLQDNQKNYFKGFGYDPLAPALGNGLLLSDGDFWRRQRKLAQPAFHRQRLVGFAEIMAEQTASLMKRWRLRESGQPLDMAREMMRLTLGIVSRTLLSTDVSDDADNVGTALSRLLEETNRRVLSVARWESLPLPRNLQFKKDLATLDRVVFRIIQERRKSQADAGDLLSMFMAARDEETGEGMDDKQLRDEVMTMFLAGHETTANWLAWSWIALSQNPGVQRKLREEISRVLGSRVPRFEDLPELRYTTMVLEEVLRLYPPAWIIARETRADDQIGGYRIPKKSMCVLSPYVVQRLPGLWSNPEGFDPERFTPDNALLRHKYAYFPFSGGSRVCIGSSFAMMEAQIVLAMIVQNFRLDLVPGHPIQPDPGITLRPRGGVQMTLHPY